MLMSRRKNAGQNQSLKTDFFDLNFLQLYKNENTESEEEDVEQQEQKFCLKSLIKDGKSGCKGKIFKVDFGLLNPSDILGFEDTFYQVQITDYKIEDN
jgi:hypothetical protein